jgi:methionine-rich copper-binding protein CopC
MFENTTAMEKRNILGSLSMISVGENWAHTRYKHDSPRNGSHGYTMLEKLTLWPPADGDGDPCTSILVLENNNNNDNDNNNNKDDDDDGHLKTVDASLKIQ